MKPLRFSLTIVILAACITAFSQEFIVPATKGMSWYKGNTHMHSSRSEGNGSVEEMASWYKGHGYDFLVVTDDSLSLDSGTASKVSDSGFLLIPGAEIKSSIGSRQIHVNSLNATKPIKADAGDTDLSSAQKVIDAIRGAGGVPAINHPLSMGGLDRETILATRNCGLIEVFNAAVGPFLEVKSGYLTTEEYWDYLLSNGREFYGLAADDAHALPGRAKSGPSILPGQAWVVVRARSLSSKDICRSLEQGLFYASTGIKLKDIVVEPKRMTIAIDAEGSSGVSTCFIGKDGKRLLTTKDNPAVYELKADTEYVRAKVTDSARRAAWIQPIFIR